MSKIFFSFLVSTATLSGLAQEYTPFPDSNVIWREYETWHDGGANRSSCTSTTTRIVGDTIIDSIKYQILHRTKIMWNGPFQSCTTGTKDVEEDTIGYYRNDIINKKLWVRLPRRLKDTLFYDFDLKIGDTIFKSYLFDSYPIYEDLIVDSIGEYEKGEIKRRSYFIKAGYSQNNIITLIEGIGSNIGFLKPFNASGYGIVELTCMRIDTTLVYGHHGCDLITSIIDGNIESNQLSIYPNPTSKHVIIPRNNDVEYISLYNLQGQRLKKISPNKDSETTIGIEGPSGIYLLQIRMLGGAIVSTKVVKQ